jgi:hypothetical protein
VHGDADLVEDQQVAFCPFQNILDLLPPLPGQADILLCGLVADEAFASVLMKGDLGCEALEGFQLAIEHTFDELSDEHLQAPSCGPQGQTQGGCGFALAVSGVDLHESLFHDPCDCSLLALMRLFPEVRLPEVRLARAVRR